MPNSKRKAHCNKAPYPTLVAAKAALKRTLAGARKCGRDIVTHLTAYKCPYCPKFHVGRDRFKGIDWAAVERHEREQRAAIAQRKGTPA